MSISPIAGRRGLLMVIALTVASAACRDGTAPPKPASIETAQALPSATAGLPLTTAPTFSVRDAGGNILGGIAIAVNVTAGAGTVTATPGRTLADVPTPIGTWTLGTTTGINTLTVSVGNLTPLAITVMGVPGPPASVAIVGGNSQIALAGTTLGTPLTAQLRDRFGNGIPGTALTFAVTAGGGAVAPATATTDANGNATGAQWRLGRSAVTQTVTVTSGALSTQAAATVGSDFNVDVRVFGPDMPPEATAGFAEAAARIRASVVGDITDVDLSSASQGAGFNISNCGVPGVVLAETVDDVLIFASVTSIDGPGKVLASTLVCLVRGVSQFAVVGVMRFDVDDIAGLISSGRLNTVILHEMLHVVGVGTNWRGKALLTGAGGIDPRYTGVLGVGGCTSGGGASVCATGVPVENSGGVGTADSHWRESIFDSELMTGFVEAPNIPMPLSAMTIQSLADAAYSVNVAAADPYTVPAPPAIRELRSNVSVAERPPWETVTTPMYVIDQRGVIREMRSP